MLLICTTACSVTKSIVSLLSKCKYRGGEKLIEKQLQTDCPEEFSLFSWNVRQNFCSASWWKSRSLYFLEIRGTLNVVPQVSYMGWINDWIACLNSRAGKIGDEFFRHMVVPCFGEHLWDISPVHSNTTKPSIIFMPLLEKCYPSLSTTSAHRQHSYSVHYKWLFILTVRAESTHTTGMWSKAQLIYIVKTYWVSIEAFQSSRNYASTTTQPSLLIIGQFAKLHGWSCS